MLLSKVSLLEFNIIHAEQSQGKTALANGHTNQGMSAHLGYQVFLLHLLAPLTSCLHVPSLHHLFKLSPIPLASFLWSKHLHLILDQVSTRLNLVNFSEIQS